MTFENYLNIGQILVSVMLIVVVLLQAKGSGFGAGLGGTRRPSAPGAAWRRRCSRRRSS